MTLKFSNETIELSNNSIFLAGPTGMTGFNNSWRKEACGILEDLKFNGLVYIPEYSNNSPFDEVTSIEAQIKWEWSCLEVAGIIVFWIPRNMKTLPGMTTNVEFGIYTTMKPEQVVLGYPESAEKMKYIDTLYRDRTSRRPNSTLEETLKEAVNRLRGEDK